MGVLFWLALVPFQIPLFFLLASESCIAFLVTCFEKEGVNPSLIRQRWLGRMGGSLLGGVILRHYGQSAVFYLEAFFFWLALVFTAWSPLPVLQEHANPPPAPKNLAKFLILLNCLPDISIAMIFYASDRLAFSPVEFGQMEALGSLCMLLGTFIHVPRLPILYSLALTLNNWFVLLLLTRWVLGMDMALFMLPAIPVAIFGSALVTHYETAAGKDVAFWSTLPMSGQVVGFVLSNSLTWAFGVNHDSFENLLSCFTATLIFGQVPLVAAAWVRDEAPVEVVV